jgi:antitoxin HicB
MMFQYSVTMAWSKEDGGYVATVPELPNLSAFGETAPEAAQEIELAAVAFVAAMEETGVTAPPALALPSFSGQFRVRVPASLHETLVSHARREGVSLNTLVVSLLAEGLGAAGERFLDPGSLAASRGT